MAHEFFPSSNPQQSQPAEIATQSGQAHVDAHASQLIDELFTDIDDLLTEEPDHQLALVVPDDIDLTPEIPETTVMSIDVWPPEPDPEDATALVVPSTEEEMALFDPFAPLLGPYADGNLTLWTPAAAPPPPNNPQDHTIGPGRLMFYLGCASVFSVLLLWLGSRLVPRQPAIAIAPQTQAAAPPEQQPQKLTVAEQAAQIQFADAMARSQQRIQDLSDAAARAKVATLTQPTSRTATAAPAAAPTAAAPQPPAALSIAAAPQPQASQVAVSPSPLPKAALAKTTAAPATTTAAPAATAPTTSQATAPSTSQTPAQFPPANPAPTASSASTASPAATSQPSVAAAPTPAVPNVNLAKTAPPLTASTNPTHILKGVLNLGADSRAMVEHNGGTRLVKIGEDLNGSGLILRSVEGQKIIAQHGADLHSLTVGQKF